MIQSFFFPREIQYLGSTISKDRTYSGTNGDTCIVTNRIWRSWLPNKMLLKRLSSFSNLEAPRKARPRRLAGKCCECGQALWGKYIPMISRYFQILAAPIWATFGYEFAKMSEGMGLPKFNLTPALFAASRAGRQEGVQ